MIEIEQARAFVEFARLKQAHHTDRRATVRAFETLSLRDAERLSYLLKKLNRNAARLKLVMAAQAKEQGE